MDTFEINQPINTKQISLEGHSVCPPTHSFSNSMAMSRIGSFLLQYALMISFTSSWLPPFKCDMKLGALRASCVSITVAAN